MTSSRAQHSGSRPSLAGLRVLVMGLGRFGGGVGVTRWLAGEGAAVTVTDQADGASLAVSIEALAGHDVTLHLGGHDLRDLDAADLVVVNPAVRKSRSDMFREIQRRGISWTTETNLFCERCPATVVAVTGSYGKSTTCAMLAVAIGTCRKDGPGEYTGVHLGGNIGRSLLGELDTIRSTDLVVLEMSNAQLEDLPRIDWTPSIAVITNLKPHHLDRYDTHADYVRAKLNIVGNARHTERVVVGDLDAEAERVFQGVVAGQMCRVVRASRPDPPVELRIPGDHNQANVACVLAVCRGLGIDGAAVRESMRSFGGLPHRLEFVRTLDGVDYYNDSKSTSPSTTLTAVRALDRAIVAIVGGQLVGRVVRPDVAGSAGGVGSDESDLRPWAEDLLCACRIVICTWEAGPKFARVLRAVEGRVQESGVREAAGTVEAIRLARGQAKQGDVVLFSPGAPSFDAYANFADRGRHFVETVNAMS